MVKKTLFNDFLKSLHDPYFRIVVKWTGVAIIGIIFEIDYRERSSYGR